MSIYSDKLAHARVVINSQMCTCEDTLPHYLGAPYLYDFMSQNKLTTSIAPSRVLILEKLVGAIYTENL